MLLLRFLLERTGKRPVLKDLAVVGQGPEIARELRFFFVGPFLLGGPGAVVGLQLFFGPLALGQRLSNAIGDCLSRFRIDGSGGIVPARRKVL